MEYFPDINMFVSSGKDKLIKFWHFNYGVNPLNYNYAQSLDIKTGY